MTVATLAFRSAAGDGTLVGSPACAQCGAPVVRRRRARQQDESLCLACDRRARRAAYFRAYYESHKDRILDKNRRWARDNRDKLLQLRQARTALLSRPGTSQRRCVDCGASVIRATRCRRCYIRFRYATDPEYRERRLATTRRWLSRRATSPRAVRSGDRDPALRRRLQQGQPVPVTGTPAAALTA